MDTDIYAIVQAELISKAQNPGASPPPYLFTISFPLFHWMLGGVWTSNKVSQEVIDSLHSKNSFALRVIEAEQKAMEGENCL